MISKPEMFIKILTDSELRKENVKRFYHTVKNNSAHDVIGSVMVEGPTGEPTPTLMIHRINEDGKHEYELCLNRHLTPEEIQNVAEKLNAYMTEGNFLLETSTFDDECCPHMDDSGVYIESDVFNKIATVFAERQHNKWLHERMKNGWRYGQIRDDKQRTHPLIKPWNQLSEDQKTIDFSFPGFFIDVLEDFGYTIVSKEELSGLMKNGKNRR